MMYRPSTSSANVSARMYRDHRAQGIHRNVREILRNAGLDVSGQGARTVPLIAERSCAATNVPYVADQTANGWTAGAPVPSRFFSSPVGSAQVQPDERSRSRRLLDRLLHANHDVADSAGVAERRDRSGDRRCCRRPHGRSVISGLVVPIRRTVASDVTTMSVVIVRHGDRDVESVRDAVASRTWPNADLGVDRVDSS